MNNRTVAVLLVGSGARSARGLQDHLKRRGCDISFAASCREALQMLHGGQFDLVLSEFTLSDGTAYGLMPSLRGTGTTMFFSNAVEAGCWWMNAIYKGKDRSDEPGMHPAEFRTLLDEILLDRVPGKTKEAGSAGAVNGHAEL